METVNAKGKIRRPGSGRTKGSYSFVLASIEDLTGKIADHKTRMIKISRKQAEELGLNSLISMGIKELGGKIDGVTPATKVEQKLHVFED